MNKDREYDLIVTIVNRGNADIVIEASKKAGAQGGTVFYGRGTGINEVETFFGISIQPEKEVVFTLIKHDLTKSVIHSIIEKAGLSTPGKGISFALPVDDVAGITHLTTPCSVEGR